MDNRKTYYVTTSIPYVNGDPHIGHALEFIQADALARYARQQGKQVLFSTGTDEHGTKILNKAVELNKKPQEFVDEIAAKFVALLQQLNVSNNKFVRTSDKNHEDRAQLVWQALTKDIYKHKYSGLYCVGCEEFVTEAVAKENNGDCPIHKKPYEKLEEDNYYFRLSNYTAQILQLIETDELRIRPQAKRNEILSLLQKEGLNDIAISRPKERLSWGIPVPGDPEHVMYVWFEALMNYITVIGYPEHEEFKTYWPADVQVVGKDILRFHAAIWPGMLLGLGLPPQRNLYVHGHITVDGEKMSKSLGNVIAPGDVADRYGADPMRYFFLRHISSLEDGDFSWEKFDDAYNNELANELGNAVSRISAMIQRYQNGVIGDMPERSHDTSKYHEAMAEFRFDRALDEVWEQVRGLNQYIDQEKPWVIAKDGDADHLREVLAYAAGCLIEISTLLKPFLPDTAEKIRAIFDKGILHPLESPLFPKAQ